MNSHLPDSQASPLDHVLCSKRGARAGHGHCHRHGTRRVGTRGRGEPTSGERGWEEPGGPGWQDQRGPWSTEGVQAQPGRGLGAQEEGGELGTHPLYVCLPSLPPLISLPSCLYFLPPHPLLGNGSSEAPQSPSSPSRVDPKAPKDTHRRADSQAPVSGVFFWGGAARPWGPLPGALHSHKGLLPAGPGKAGLPIPHRLNLATVRVPMATHDLFLVPL